MNERKQAASTGGACELFLPSIIVHMLLPSQPAPDFTLPDASGVQHTLSHALARGPALLVFYPADATPLCTKQNCLVRDRFGELTAAGITVFGLSPQRAELKKDFSGSQRLPQVLLVDAGSKVAKLYGARGMFGLPLPFGTRRMTFFVERKANLPVNMCGEVVLAAHEEFGLTVHEALMDRALQLARASVAP